MRKLPILFAMLLAFAVTMVPEVKSARADDFIDLDLTNVLPAQRPVFRRAERFWEARVRGYSASLPTEVRSQITGRLSIDASTQFIDGVGGILGAAGPDQIAQSAETIGNPANGRFRLTTVPVTGSMVFDIADAGRADFESTVLHEMGHVLGIGTMWSLNGIVNAAGTELGLLQQRQGGFHYIGREGIRGFREESGHHRANYVPVEQGGGPGSALGHWAANWFTQPANGSRSEIMLAFATPRTPFLAKMSVTSLHDTGFETIYSNGATVLDTGAIPVTGPIPGGGFPKGTRGFTPLNRIVAVPEPSSLSFLGLGLFGLVLRRKRS